MGNLQINTGKGNQTVNTNSVWDRIVELENNVGVGSNGLSARMESVELSLGEKAKLIEVIDLNRWGIKNDGTNARATTDGINNALQWYSTNGYRHVVLPSGTYLIDSVNESQPTADKRNVDAGIKPPSNMTFEMKSDTVLKVETNGSPSYACIFLSKTQNNIKIIGGQILGDRKTHDYVTSTTYTTHEHGHGIYVYGASNILIENLTIKDCTGDSITLHSPGMIGIDPVNNPYAPPSRVRINNCVLDSARRNNISVTACDYVIIENCQILNAGINDGIKDGTLPKYGIDLEGYGEGSVDYETPLRIIIRGNKFVGNVTASAGNYSGYEVIMAQNFSDNTISFGYGTDTIISNNVFKRNDNTQTAISALGVSQGEDGNHVTITGNTINGFSVGIDVRGKNISVVGNTIFNTLTAISTYTAEQVLIEGNVVRKATAKGISLSQSNKIRCIGNYVRDTPLVFEIWNSSTEISAMNNVFEYYNTGIKITGGSAIVIKGNTMEQSDYATKSYSIQLDSNAVALIEGNILKSPASYPIYCVGGSGTGRVRILNNSIEGFTGTVGVMLTAVNKYEVSGNHVISGMTFAGGNGIQIGSSVDGALIIGNRIYTVTANALTNAINTSTGTNSKIHANVCLSGVISNAASDVLNGNIIA